jgi:hypothetical protein
MNSFLCGSFTVVVSEVKGITSGKIKKTRTVKLDSIG